METLIIDVPDDDKDRQRALEAILKLMGYPYTKTKSATVPQKAKKTASKTKKA